MVFFTYRTKQESPAGNQFSKFCRQCSIFGRTGNQWVAISNPEWPFKMWVIIYYDHFYTQKSFLKDDVTPANFVHQSQTRELWASDSHKI